MKVQSQYNEEDVKFVVVAVNNGPMYGSKLFQTYPQYYVLGEEGTTYPNLKQAFYALDPPDLAALERGDIRIFKLTEVKHQKLIVKAFKRHCQNEEEAL